MSILTLRLRTVHVRRSPKIAVGQGGGVLVIGVRLKVKARGKVRRTPLGSRFEPCVSTGPLGLGSGSGLALGLKVEPRVCRPGRRTAHTWFACACTYGLPTRTRRALCRPWSRPPAYRQSRRSPSRRTRRRKRGPPRRRRRTLAKAPDDTPHQRAASMAAAAAATTAAGSAVAGRRRWRRRRRRRRRTRRVWRRGRSGRWRVRLARTQAAVGAVDRRDIAAGCRRPVLALGLRPVHVRRSPGWG